MVVAGAHFDLLYATHVLDIRRRVSLGIAPPQELEFVTTPSGAEAASRKFKVDPEPDSWVAKQEWSVDTSASAHLRMRLHAALHDYHDRILPTLDTPRFIADNALCALYLTWLLVDEGVPQLLPHTSSCQALPWDGEHGRASLAAEWFVPARVERWERLLEHSLALLGSPAGDSKHDSISVMFEQSAGVGEVVRVSGQAGPQSDSDAMTFAAKSVVRLTAQDLRRFDPAAASLREIGGHYFRVIGAHEVALASARSGELGFLGETDWERIHTQFRLALEFAIRCAGGLGVRLAASGLIADPHTIEKRACEIVLALKHLDLLQSGAVPGERRVGTAHLPHMRVLAEELSQLGSAFAQVTAAAELDGWSKTVVPDYYNEPLSETSVLTAAVLCRLPLDCGLTASNIVKEVYSVFGAALDETTVKKAITSQLKPWGVQHRKHLGYFVPASRRIALLTRIRPTLEREYGRRAPDS